MKKEAFQKKVQLFYLILIPWKVFHWQLKDFKLLTANYCRRTSRDIRRNQEKTLLRNHLVDSASTPVDNRLNKTLIYFFWLLLVAACAEAGRDVAAEGLVPRHRKAGWVAPHLKHSCLKLQPKHFSPWCNFQQKPFGQGWDDCFLALFPGEAGNELCVMWCACNHNSQCISSQGKRDFCRK